MPDTGDSRGVRLKAAQQITIQVAAIGAAAAGAIFAPAGPIPVLDNRLSIEIQNQEAVDNAVLDHLGVVATGRIITPGNAWAIDLDANGQLFVLGGANRTICVTQIAGS